MNLLMDEISKLHIWLAKVAFELLSSEVFKGILPRIDPPSFQ
jgi:hypothetical protein